MRASGRDKLRTRQVRWVEVFLPPSSDVASQQQLLSDERHRSCVLDDGFGMVGVMLS